MRVGRRSISLLAAAFLPAALVLGAAALGASTADVTIKDTGISPTTASVDRGGFVSWTNAGTKPHAVASLDSSFPAFVLLASGSRSVTFKKTGCYPYTVDGRFDGKVRVGGASCAGVSPPPPSPGRPKIVRYDVAIVGHAARTETSANEPDPKANGKQVLTTDWTMTWTGLRYSVRDFGRSVIVVPVKRAAVKKGTLTARSSFSETRNRQMVGGGCRGKVVYPRYRASLFVNMTVEPVLWTLQAGTAVGSQLAGYNRTTLDRQKAACNGNILGYPGWSSTVARTVHGVALDLTFLSELLSVHAERRGGNGRPFPVASMIAGRSFSIPAREFQLVQTGACRAPAECTAKLRTSVRITFTARR